MSVNEKYEWSNFWWEDADDATLPRLLLIGDSITAGYRPFVNEHYRGRIAVDMLATSRAVDGPALGKELTYVLSECEYGLIHFNNGLHGFHLDLPGYGSAYRRVVDMICELAPHSQLALVTSTPIWTVGRPEELDDAKNAVVVARNRVVTQCAEDRALPTDDLYRLSQPHREWRSEDGYHFNEDGRRSQGAAVAAFIGGQLGLG